MKNELLGSYGYNYLYIIAFILAFIVTLLATPYSKKLAIKIGAIDQPKDRSMHKKPMPLAGGTAIVLGFIITVILFAPTIDGFELNDYIGLIGGGLLITTIGLLDDIYDLKALTKLIFQIMAALIVVFSGTSIVVLSWPFGEAENLLITSPISEILTIVWIIGITNAVNLIDGLDGLATGVSSIASFCLMLIAILYGGDNAMAVLLTAALAGACMGFLPYNFNPAKIFMGDTGSTFLGFTLAVISIQGFIKSYTAVTLIVSILILGLPIFAASFAILRRIINKKPVMQADRGHLHHRLVDKGYSQKRAVLTLYGISGGFGLAGILVAMNDIIFAMCIVGFIIAIWLIDGINIRNKKKKGQI